MAERKSRDESVSQSQGQGPSQSKKGSKNGSRRGSRVPSRVESSDESDGRLEKEMLRELANIKMESGLSDSEESLVKDAESGGPLTDKRRSWIGPPVPKDRDAMGGYKVPVGGRPLSSRDLPNKPAPNEYYPDVNVVMRSFPQWTLGEVADRRPKGGTPGPNAYGVHDPRYNKGIKGASIKTKKFPPDRREGFGRFSRGPAAISLSRNICTGPKYSIRHKPRSYSTMPGLTSTLAREPDPRVPGPEYKPDDEEWLQKPQTFGIKPEKKQVETPGPNYNAPNKPTGPAWHFGLAAKDPKSRDKKPGPQKYNIRSSMGDGPKAPLGLKWRPNKYTFNPPGPDVYDRAGFNLSEPGYTMKYRWFDSEEDPKPGPKYYPSLDPVKDRAPAYTMPLPAKAKKSGTGPSPAQYNLPGSLLGKGPVIGQSKRDTGEPQVGPGPADYQDGDQPFANLPRAPAFTMGYVDKRKPASSDIPGPNAYVLPTPKTTGKTIGLRSKASKYETIGPGPFTAVSLDCPPCQSAEGPTLKSRHSPHKYLGLKENAQPAPASLSD